MADEHCSISRQEAYPDLEAPECTHPDTCDQWWAECRYDYVHALCDRPRGHVGDHGDWIGDRDIVVFFLEAAPSGTGGGI